MKPIITETDAKTLKNLIENLPYNFRTKDIGLLLEEINRGEIVKDNEIPDDVIRLHSYFEVKESNGNQVMKFTLTLPKEANIQEKKVSVLSPMGVALIGFKEGAEIEWELPGGKKKITILKVENSAN